jgi:hypothetical protein
MKQTGKIRFLDLYCSVQYGGIHSSIDNESLKIGSIYL